jgi:hypothetical protein
MGSGLTTLTCLANLAKHLDAEDRLRAMFHGISEVASDCDGQPPRFPVRPLPGAGTDDAQLKRWFRQFVEVRDSEGAERCIASARRDGCDTIGTRLPTCFSPRRPTIATLPSAMRSISQTRRSKRSISRDGISRNQGSQASRRC